MKRNAELLAISTFAKVGTSSIHCLTASNKSFLSADPSHPDAYVTSGGELLTVQGLWDVLSHSRMM